MQASFDLFWNDGLDAKNLLPPDALQALAPKFAAAEKALGRHTDNAKTRWADRIAVIHRALPLIPPPIAPAVREAVFTALATNTQVHVHYRKAYEGELKQYPLHPQALVVREGIIYLIATARDYTEPRQFAMHRMQKAKLLDTPARRLPDFDLETFPLRLAAVLDSTEMACVRLALATRDEDRRARAADALREVAHARDVALVIERHARMFPQH